MTASMPILKLGMTGTAVEIWQRILCIAGYGVAVDGSFGPDTQDKTRQFELSKGITDDPHEAGPVAWKAGLERLNAVKSF